jgi:hypothetical protein
VDVNIPDVLPVAGSDWPVSKYFGVLHWVDQVCTKCFIKGQCHEIFDFRCFLWISFPQAPEYTIRAVLNFSKIRGDIRSSRCTTWVVDTGGAHSHAQYSAQYCTCWHTASTKPTTSK